MSAPKEEKERSNPSIEFEEDFYNDPSRVYQSQSELKNDIVYSSGLRNKVVLSSRNDSRINSAQKTTYEKKSLEQVQSSIEKIQTASIDNGSQASTIEDPTTRKTTFAERQARKRRLMNSRAFTVPAEE